MRPWFAVALLAASGPRARSLAPCGVDDVGHETDPDDVILIDVDVLEDDVSELAWVPDGWVEAC